MTRPPRGSREINVLEDIGAVARTTLKSKRRAEDWTSWRSPKPSYTTRRGSTGKGAPTGTSSSGAAGQPIAREANVIKERPVITGTSPEVFMSSERLARRGWRKRDEKQQKSMVLPRSPTRWSRTKRETQRSFSKHLSNVRPFFLHGPACFRGRS